MPDEPIQNLPVSWSEDVEPMLRELLKERINELLEDIDGTHPVAISPDDIRKQWQEYCTKKSPGTIPKLLKDVTRSHLQQLTKDEQPAFQNYAQLRLTLLNGGTVEQEKLAQQKKLLLEALFQPFSRKVHAYFEEDEPGSGGIHFYKVRFQQGQIIMPKEVHSDYCGFLLSGTMSVHEKAALSRSTGSLPECWGRPGPVRRWLGRLLKSIPGLRPRRPSERTLSQPTFNSSLANLGEPLAVVQSTHPTLQRFMGVVSVIWNLKRTVTLAAWDQPCEVLLIKRKALLEIIDLCPALAVEEVNSFLDNTLPRYLAKNRLFRDTFYPEDIAEASWKPLLELLQNKVKPAELRSHFREGFRDWLDALKADELDEVTRYRIVRELNDLLKKDLSRLAALLPPDRDDPALRDLLQQKDSPDFTPAQKVRLNRLLVQAAYPGLLKDSHADLSGSGGPFSLEECRQFVRDLRKHSSGPLIPQEHGTFQADVRSRGRDNSVVYDQGADADALYLILSGRFRVVQRVPGGDMVINHLDEDGYFGQRCLEPEQKRRSRVEALTLGRVLRLERGTLEKLVESYPWFKRKLQRETGRMESRDEQLQSGARHPPRLPPPEIAGQLLKTTNLLLIDMEKCTRCDQCVRACGESHENRPRFHRANPNLRFDKWEVAGACLHCKDAPCQNACPVGAIELLSSGAFQVQLHRDRCIGCKKCAQACPFDVITMYPRTSPEEAPNVKVDKKSGQAAPVATKCDLCLIDQPNRPPPCVAACPYGAAQRGSPLDLFEDMKGMAVFVDEPPPSRLPVPKKQATTPTTPNKP